VYDGYVKFGSLEVINTERLQAYVDHGIVPPGVDVTACSDCDGLAEALTPGVGPYRTPLLDLAPWVDINDPDTFDFTGLLPLIITGLDGSTSSVVMTETLDGRAVPGRRTFAARQVGVTGLLTGRTTEGVQAGLRWLTALLHRTCITDGDCASAAPVEMFSVCPTPIYPVPDLDATEQVEHTIPGWTDPDGGWTAVDGEYIEYYGDSTAGMFNPIGTETIDGGDPDSTVDPALDGGAPDGVFDSPEVYDGGDPGPFEGDGGYVWRDAALGPVCGPVTLQFCLTTDPLVVSAPVNVTLMLLDPLTGEVLDYGPQVVVGIEEECQPWVHPDGIDLENWAVGFAADGPLVNAGVLVQHFPLLSPEACIGPYRRIMPAATVTSSPTITERLLVADCAEWLKVEWVWTIGSAFKFSTPERLVTDNRAEFGPPPFVATGVSTARYGWIEPGTVSTPWNCAPPVDTVTCASDPCLPGWVAPPAPPVVPDPTFATISGGAFIMGTSVCIDSSVTAAGDNVLTITLTADDQPKVGVRVRIYDDVQGDCTETDKCEWVAEYLIDYIPADGVVTIDGVNGTITTVCPGFTEPQPTPVRGDYGGPIKQPVICGDRRILVQTQWLRRYPRECEGFYEDNLHQGDLLTSVDVSAREG